MATVLVIYLLAIGEGSIRKYALPELSQYLFFVRDPFLLYAYVVATRYGLWPRRDMFFTISVLMGAAGVLLFLLQVGLGIASETRLLLGVYGWRSYFLYVPLAFLVGAQFRAADLTRFAKVTLLLAAPVALLVAAQFFAAPDAWINVGIAEDKDLQFRGMTQNVDHIRPSGTFSSNAGQQQFVATAAAFLFAAMLLPGPRRQFGLVVLATATAAILTCVGLSGSRGTLLQVVLIGAFATVVALVGRGAALKARALVLPAAIGVAAAVLYPVVFPEGFSAFSERWTAAQAWESRSFDGGVFGRALYGLIDFARLVGNVPPFGYGLGYGGNASVILGATVDGVKVGSLAETDFSRHMVDLGPALGIAYIAFRVAFVVGLGRLVWRATRSVPDPLPMMMFSYASFVVLQSQVTGNGTINVYAWLFAGLCIAASRQALLAGRVSRRPDR